MKGRKIYFYFTMVGIVRINEYLLILYSEMTYLMDLKGKNCTFILSVHLTTRIFESRTIWNNMDLFQIVLGLNESLSKDISLATLIPFHLVSNGFLGEFNEVRWHRCKSTKVFLGSTFTISQNYVRPIGFFRAKFGRFFFTRNWRKALTNFQIKEKKVFVLS